MIYEPFIPDIDYANNEDVSFLRQNLEQRYQELKQLKQYKRPKSSNNETMLSQTNKNIGNQLMNNNILSKTGNFHLNKTQKEWQKNMAINKIEKQNIKQKLTDKQFKNQHTLAPFLQSYLQNQIVTKEPHNENYNSELYNEKVRQIMRINPIVQNLNINENSEQINNSLQYEQEDDSQIINENNQNYLMGNYNHQNSQSKKKPQKLTYNKQHSLNGQLQLHKFQQIQRVGTKRINYSQREQNIATSEIYIRNTPTYDCDPENSVLIDMQQQYQNLNMQNINQSAKKQQIISSNQAKEQQVQDQQNQIQKQQNYQKNINNFNNENINAYKSQLENNQRAKKLLLKNSDHNFRQTFQESFYYVQQKNSNQSVCIQDYNGININNDQNNNFQINVRKVSKPSNKANRSVSVDGNYFLVRQLRPSGKEVKPSSPKDKRQNYQNYEEFQKKQLKQNTPMYLNKTNRIYLEQQQFEKLQKLNKLQQSPTLSPQNKNQDKKSPTLEIGTESYLSSPKKHIKNNNENNFNSKKKKIRSQTNYNNNGFNNTNNKTYANRDIPSRLSNSEQEYNDALARNFIKTLQSNQQNKNHEQEMDTDLFRQSNTSKFSFQKVNKNAEWNISDGKTKQFRAHQFNQNKANQQQQLQQQAFMYTTGEGHLDYTRKSEVKQTFALY